MSRFSPASFALGAGALSAAAIPALALLLRDAPGDASAWGVLGFTAMALPSVGCGAWLAREHGRTGASFLVALGAGWVLRAVLLAAIVIAALRLGPGAIRGALTGLAAGFVALTAFEILWFARRTRREGFPTGRGA